MLPTLIDFLRVSVGLRLLLRRYGVSTTDMCALSLIELPTLLLNPF